MSENNQELTGAGMGIVAMLLTIGFALALYLFFCFCCKKICEKCGVTPGVLIWIPIVNLVPLLQVAKLPVWMIILFFIPLVNFVVAVMMWAKICIARGKSGWLVILMFIPIVNLGSSRIWRLQISGCREERTAELAVCLEQWARSWVQAVGAGGSLRISCFARLTQTRSRRR